MSTPTDMRTMRLIEKLLGEGLPTRIDPIPEDDKAWSEILNELRELAPDDVKGKLVVSGWIDHPRGEQSCMNCMYFLTNRRWCDLPELALPARPGWWCRLWRV